MGFQERETPQGGQFEGQQPEVTQEGLPLGTTEPRDPLRRPTFENSASGTEPTSPIRPRRISEHHFREEAEELFEESPELGFKIGFFVKDKILHTPVVGSIIDKTAKGAKRAFLHVYDRLQDSRIEKIIEHPTRHKIARRSLMRYTFHQAFPRRFEQFEIDHPNAARRLKRLDRTVRFIAMAPFLPIPLVIPFLELPFAEGIPIELPNPTLTLVFKHAIPFLLNQSATFAMNTAKTIQSLSRREPIGTLAYGIPGVLDTFLPFFGTVPFIPVIDKAIAAHYDKRVNTYFERSDAKLHDNPSAAIGRYMQEDIAHFTTGKYKTFGVAKQRASLTDLQTYLQRAQELLQDPLPRTEPRNLTGLHWLRKSIAFVQNTLDQMDYDTRENRRQERLKAGLRILQSVSEAH